MIEWYKDKELSIFFDERPAVAMRLILPSMSKEEKKSIHAYPFENKRALNVTLFNNKTQQVYKFTIPKGFCWDGATIPRVFWRLIGAKTDAKFLIPSMIHDWMCNYHASVGHDRNFSSRVFRALLYESGVNKPMAQMMYLAVDNFQRLCKWKPVVSLKEDVK